MRRETSYKGIGLIYDDELNSVEFGVLDKNLDSPDSYINFITLVAEYVEIRRPDYILFNKLHSDYEVAKSTMGFTKSIIFSQLKSCGVRKILMVVKSRAFEDVYSDIEKKNPFMKGFLNLEDAYQWILENRKL